LFDANADSIYRGLIHYLVALKLYNKQWGEYLIQRTHTSSFIIAAHTIPQKIKRGVGVDFGCGSGHLLPILRCSFNTVYGIDLSLTHLLLADVFFADSKTVPYLYGRQYIPDSNKTEFNYVHGGCRGYAIS
jgi:SAM-dependent methyltransferase